jgi:PadR family transcriptional regulator PadR
MDLENAKAQMRKGILEMCVLAVIAQEEIYPPIIMKKLERTELVVKEGTLYPLLVRLKNDGLVDYIWREGEKGPPRKYFTITDEGRQALGELTESWQQLVQAVGQTLDVQNEAPTGHTPTRKLNIEPMPPKA